MLSISREKRQVLLLGGVLVLIVAALLYMYRGVFLPRAEGDALTAPAARLDLPKLSDQGAFFEREDYRALRSTPGVPVLPLPVTTQGVNPFEVPK